jgi:hypothetical protein
VQLLRIEPEPGGVCLHNGDPENECFAAFTLFLNLFGQLANLAFEVILLDCGTADKRILPLPLLRRSTASATGHFGHPGSHCPATTSGNPP